MLTSPEMNIAIDEGAGAWLSISELSVGIGNLIQGRLRLSGFKVLQGFDQNGSIELAG